MKPRFGTTIGTVALSIALLFRWAYKMRRKFNRAW